MELETLPSSYEELLGIFREERKLSFTISNNHKKRFLNCIKRQNKLNSLFRKKRGFVNTSITYIYGMYVGVMFVLSTRPSKSLENAIIVYQVAWKNIARIDGEQLPNGKATVVYHART